MPITTPSTATIVRRAKHELREYALLFVYLYVCFGALTFYKMAILGGVGVSYLSFGLAAIKALILAKFILLGRAVRLGERHRRRRLVYAVAEKALLYLVLLIVLSVVEEAIVGVAHGRTVAALLAEHLTSNLPQILAPCLIMLLILIPYLAFKELDVALGEGRLRELLLGDRARLPSDRSAEVTGASGTTNPNDHLSR